MFLLRSWVLVLLVLSVSVGADTSRGGATPTALDRYVAAPDAAFAWSKVAEWRDGADVAFALEMTSQRWLTATEVDRPDWKHQVTVIKPGSARGSLGLLVISGGSNRPGEKPRSPSRELIEIARATKSVVVELRHVPNEPLTFFGDGQARKEDDILAYSWVKYMQTGDERWPGRLPMTKAAVRAMDAATQFLASEAGGQFRLESFVVTGASKRGWTTWATAAVDRRVVAICPMVIDVLNVEASFRHHFRAYGFYAPAVGDYVRQGVIDWFGAAESKDLYAIEDPFSYRDRLTLPKLLINACGDQFFLPDSSRFYFSQLPGVKYLRYVPNTDHSLKGTDAVQTLSAWHEAVVRQLKLPEVTWDHPSPGDVVVRSSQPPTEVKLWQATNAKARDFRLETLGAVWTATPVANSAGSYRASVTKPEEGWRAYMVELTFDIGATHPLKVTTDVTVIPDTLPFDAPRVNHPPGFLSRASEK